MFGHAGMMVALSVFGHAGMMVALSVFGHAGMMVAFVVSTRSYINRMKRYIHPV